MYLWSVQQGVGIPDVFVGNALEFQDFLPSALQVTYIEGVGIPAFFVGNVLEFQDFFLSTAIGIPDIFVRIVLEFQFFLSTPLEFQTFLPSALQVTYRGC